MYNMVFSRTGERGGEQGKCLREMSSKPTSGLSSIFELRLSDQSNHQIIEGGHHLACVPHCHSGSILLEGHISSIMESGFDAPMRTANLQETSRRSLGAR